MTEAVLLKKDGGFELTQIAGAKTDIVYVLKHKPLTAPLPIQRFEFSHYIALTGFDGVRRLAVYREH